MAFRVVLEQRKHRLSYCVWTLKRNNHATLLRQQLLRVPIWSRDDCLPCSKGNRQRARDNLSLLPIRRDVYIRGAYMLHKFFRTHKAIIEDKCDDYTKLFGQGLQALTVALTFASPNVRMRHA